MMNYETKWEVFDDALAYAPVGMEYDPVNDDEAGDLRSCLSARYAAALPDDLPVIPEAVGEYIKNLWKYHRDLVDVFGLVRDLGITRTEPNGVLLWVAHNTDTFARAWVLGAWRVEGSGEIVKLEAEK